MKIPLIKPYITPEIKKLVSDVLDSGFLTEGQVTKDFEEKFIQFTSCSHAIAVTSCTTGLEIALRCIGAGPGDEIIVPDYTYPATASVIPITGATAVIVDIDPGSMLIDYNSIENAITPRTKAVIPVSLFGNPLDYSILGRLKEKYGIFIIEDAACSIGSSWNNIMTGNLADISVFSLHPRKFITTGEGGMITTNSSSWAEWLLSYKHFGMGKSLSREGTLFEMIGTNYKLSNIQAAIGLGQMNKIDLLLERRRELANNYVELLQGKENITIPITTSKGIHSYQSFTIFIENRDGVLKNLREKGIEVQIGTYSLHMHPAFQNNSKIRLAGPFTGSKWAFDHCLTLPLYHDLRLEEQQIVLEELTEDLN